LEKANRKGDEFQCQKCGHRGDADQIAAQNQKSRYDDQRITLYTPKETIREILLKDYQARLEHPLRHEVAPITVKAARAGLHPLFHQRFSTGMNKELPGQCNLILGWLSNRKERQRLPASRRSGARNGSYGQEI